MELGTEREAKVSEPALEPIARAEHIGVPAVEPVVAAAPVAQSPGDIAGWSEVLEKLNRTVRAVFLDAQPEMDGAVLVLWFRYGFHHKKAQEQSSLLMPHVRAWLGPEVRVDYRLREQATEPGRSAKAASPEDDPFVREVVRRFDGRVTRVKEVSE